MRKKIVREEENGHYLEFIDKILVTSTSTPTLSAFHRGLRFSSGQDTTRVPKPRKMGLGGPTPSIWLIDLAH